MELIVNGVKHQLDVTPDTPLLWVLRDNLELTGTKYGCGLAQCGACTVFVDSKSMRSCVTPVGTLEGKKITTIETIEEDDLGKKLVAAWVKHQVPQCGYCQSGQVMAAADLLKKNPRPTEKKIEATMSNLCRCGTYNAIKAAIRDVADISDEKSKKD
ncbi:2fe-2s-binding protein [Lasius niger]|uniref:2fe-2s-binding protein n=1 Tax=Lasius niger TaxID=67767 RepID=A0A0J7KQR1_LASNI|nr:2fe-2s-binding protein [Lasius niger]